MIKFEYEDSASFKDASGLQVFKAVGLGALIFLLWFGAGALLATKAVRSHPAYLNVDPTIHGKMLAYDVAPDNVSHVFVGSSRVHRQIDAPYLEVRLKEMGCSTGYIFNFGVGAASTSNTQFLLEYLLHKKPEAKRIWIEGWGADQYKTLESDRNILFAPLNPYPLWSNRFAPETDTAWGRLTHKFGLLKVGVMAGINYGSFHTLKKSSSQHPNIMEVGTQGFRPLDEINREQGPRRRQYRKIVAKNPDYFKDWHEKNTRNFEKKSWETANSDFESGLKPILSGLSREQLGRIGIVAPPMPVQSQLKLESISVNGVSLPVLTTPIADHPWLGDAALYYDRGHLNHEGSRKLTEAYAQKICRIAKEPRG